MFLRSKRGFALTNILFVVIVIAVLAVIVMAKIATTTDTAKANSCKENQAMMNTQIEQYYEDIVVWPANLATVTESTVYFPDGPPTCPSGGTYSMDPTTHRTDCSVTSPVDHSLD